MTGRWNHWGHTGFTKILIDKRRARFVPEGPAAGVVDYLDRIAVRVVSLVELVHVLLLRE
jgi:hypothetical protein